MLIEALEVEAVGPFRDRVSAGPFEKGLNILARPNEWGKSTLLKALSRAFFDRYSSAAEPIMQMRPAGGTLSPRVSVVFQAQGGRFRLVKRFLEGKSCELFRWTAERWERTDESDRADQRVRELLGAPALEGRTAKPETWGFVRYLWARQDEDADWLSWDGAAGDSARRRLAAVPIDAAMRALRMRLDERGARLFTPTGRVKVGSTLETAEVNLKETERQLGEVRARREALQELEKRHAIAVAEIPLLLRERDETARHAAELKLQAEAAEKLVAEMERLEADLARADAALRQLGADRDAEAALAMALAAAEHEGATAANALDALEPEAPKLEAQLDAQLTARAAARLEVERAEERLRKTREALRQLRSREKLSRMRAVRERVATSAAELDREKAALAALPAVTDTQLTQWRRKDQALRENRLRLEAVALRVTLIPGETKQVTDVASSRQVDVTAGARETFRTAQSLHLRLENWGEIEIFSGAAEAIALETQIAADDADLRQALAKVGLATLAEAEAVSERARELARAVKAHQAMVTAHLGEWASVAALEAAMAKEEARFAPAIDARHEEEEISEASLSAEEQQLDTERTARLHDDAAAAARGEAARAELDALRRRREEVRVAAGKAETRLKGLQEQRAALAARHPAGLTEALAAAQGNFVRAEAHVVEARRRLPPEAAMLPARSRRAAQAAAEVAEALHKRQTEQRELEIVLQERGGESLYTREAELEDDREAGRAAAARLRAEGCACRLLSAMIESHEQRIIKGVLGPLEDRLTEVFGGITGIPTRRVWLDESLGIRGVGARADALTPFHDLSRGAREQLVLALRAAVALELAKDEPQCLILDDVLVHTDPARQENVLDYLQKLGESLQIVVLTCHADRYRGVGAALQAG